MGKIEHPADHPDFNFNNQTQVWYLSHPLAGGATYGYQQNMDHIITLMRIFWEYGIRTVAPYHTICLALSDDNIAHRVAGLEADIFLCRTLGHVISAGHSMTKGMELEIQAAREHPEYHIINFVGKSDKTIKSILSAWQ